MKILRGAKAGDQPGFVFFGYGKNETVHKVVY